MTRKDIPQLGSPVYTITVGDIAAGGFQQFNLDEGIYRKYKPFDFIEIMNTNGDFFELELGDTHTFAIPGNASIVKSDLKFDRFRISNTSANPLTGAKMYVSIQHRPLDADQVARKPKGLMDYLPFAGFLMR